MKGIVAKSLRNDRDDVLREMLRIFLDKRQHVAVELGGHFLLVSVDEAGDACSRQFTRSILTGNTKMLILHHQSTATE